MPGSHSCLLTPVRMYGAEVNGYHVVISKKLINFDETNFAIGSNFAKFAIYNY